MLLISKYYQQKMLFVNVFLTIYLESVKMNERMGMSVEQVAEQTGLHPNTIYRLIKTGQLPHIKLCRKYIISRAEFEKWLAGNLPKSGGA